MAERDETSGEKPPEEAGEPPEGGADEAPPPPEGEGAAAAAPENRRARRAARAKQRGGAATESTALARPGRPPELGLDAGERFDDALSRATDRSFRWFKAHFNVVQWVIVGGAAGWIGWQIYTWRSNKASVRVSDDLAVAVGAEFGRTGSPADQGVRDERGSLDARRVFSTDEERLKAAQEGYQKVIASRANTPAAGLAKLGLAGVLYDQGKFEEARKLYEEVHGSELAKLDPEARGRSLEGIGLALEGKGDKDLALKRFTELGNAEIPGFRELGLYHQARILHAKGDLQGAKERLVKVVEKLAKEQPATPGEPPSYLHAAARQLLERIDPKAVPAPSQDEALQKMLSEFQKKLPKGVKTLPQAPPAPLEPPP